MVPIPFDAVQDVDPSEAYSMHEEIVPLPSMETIQVPTTVAIQEVPALASGEPPIPPALTPPLPTGPIMAPPDPPPVPEGIEVVNDPPVPTASGSPFPPAPELPPLPPQPLGTISSNAAPSAILFTKPANILPCMVDSPFKHPFAFTPKPTITDVLSTTATYMPKLSLYPGLIATASFAA